MNEPDTVVENLILRVLHDCHTTLSHEDIKMEVDCVLSVLYHAIIRVAVNAAKHGVFDLMTGSEDSDETDEFLEQLRREREAQQQKS